MTLNQSIPWPRIVAEGTIIVVSILLAFWIDACCSERQTRIEGSEAISQLVADFRPNAERLKIIRGVHESALDAAYEILARAGMGGQPQSEARTADSASGRKPPTAISPTRMFEWPVSEEAVIFTAALCAREKYG